MFYSVLSKCCVGNYKKRRILRHVVSLPRISSYEHDRESLLCCPSGVTRLFFPSYIWSSHDALSRVWAASSEGSDLLVSGWHFLAEGLMSGRPLHSPDSYTDAADLSCLYTASLCVPILLVWGSFISVTEVEIHHTIRVSDNVLFTFQNLVRNYKPTHPNHVHQSGGVNRDVLLAVTP